MYVCAYIYILQVCCIRGLLKVLLAHKYTFNQRKSRGNAQVKKSAATQ